MKQKAPSQLPLVGALSAGCANHWWFSAKDSRTPIDIGFALRCQYTLLARAERYASDMHTGACASCAHT